eukprot:6717133-Prymnesium_polylepis.1
MPTLASSLPVVRPPPPPPPPPEPSGVPSPVAMRTTRSAAAAGDDKENGVHRAKPQPPPSELRQAVFDAHRQFITSCVEQLE